MSRLRSVGDVADRHLCSGCGACAYLEPDKVRMVDTLRQGRRPLMLAAVNGRPTSSGEALAACPGASLQHDRETITTAPDGGVWGPVLEVLEGWAVDPQVRRRGSSGGVVSALAAFAVTAGKLSGVLHVAARADHPLLNEAVLSRTPEEVLRAAGSRYAPASPCEGLGLVEASPEPCLVIGKPCDIAATAAASRLRPALAANVAVTIGIFCAGTPSTEGTLEALGVLGIDPDDVSSVSYRGEGWPGRFRAQRADGSGGSLSYEESWGAVLQKHRLWRCMVCPDHTGEFADLSVGDPWYREIQPGEPGRSLVVVRTPRGKAFMEAAIAAGAVELRPVAREVLALSQPNLLQTRGAVWGRVAAMRMLGLAAPRYRNLPSFGVWLHRLTTTEKLRSTLGTVRRILTRGLWRRTPVAELVEPSRPTQRQQG